ncbi:hypothetical protein Q4512_16080 [Oceanihabitans sp. 2_MG-2023]|uniref:hypothetical protein n=1 Tax=Oceanihabitans sp. 2_MG-2023 TaxID=3062661 RepID=UPI0026E1F88A|nr:hypothetical protein [Oceanihabitans sp. 2_MG-2023]MDO6598438.1 hypothetical protein [Oceanihabitans sp. 2_MG-2023]
MSYSKKRIEYNNKWPNEVIIFSAQKAFLELLNDKGIINILRPIKLPLIENYEFQRLLSFKIDIYEQLPNRPDIGFDLAWRTFEAYSTYIAKKSNWSVSKTWKITNKISEDFFINQYNNNSELNSAFKELTKAVPLQATEYLIKKLFEEESSAIKSQQRQITDRVKDCIGNELFDAIEKKYGDLNADTQRRAGMLLQILLSGREIELKEKKYQLSQLQIIKLLINGILYTYRNERFHGDAFSPFKSSLTKIKTYAHSYYLLISTYFFISQLIYKDYPNLIELSEIAKSLNENTVRYNLVFEKHIKK